MEAVVLHHSLTQNPTRSCSCTSSTDLPQIQSLLPSFTPGNLNSLLSQVCVVLRHNRYVSHIPVTWLTHERAHEIPSLQTIYLPSVFLLPLLPGFCESISSRGCNRKNTDYASEHMTVWFKSYFDLSVSNCVILGTIQVSPSLFINLKNQRSQELEKQHGESKDQSSAPCTM